MGMAKRLGVETLYLSTHSAVGLDKKLGWKELEKTVYQGQEVTIMYSTLGS